MAHHQDTADAIQTVNQATMALDNGQANHYSKRSRLLRAAVLAANNGVVSTASLMMCLGAVNQENKAMILAGVVSLITGACFTAIGEFVSVPSQQDGGDSEVGNQDLPKPTPAAAVSTLAFSSGAMVPLLAASFIKEYQVRCMVVVAVVTVALAVFGWLRAILGKAPVVRSCVKFLLAGWLVVGITYGLASLIDIIYNPN